MAAHVLVVDDDPVESRHVEEIIRNHGHFVESAASGEAALTRLARADAPPVSAMILDLVMPDLDGMAVLERLSRRAMSVPVIVQAAPGASAAGAAALRAGAFDFLVKPATPERVGASLANALRIGALASEVLRMRLGRTGVLGLNDIVMRSPGTERVHRLAEQAARSALPVLIEGEHGVGKELLARAIHGTGARRARPFVTVDCADIDDDGIADLFGVVDGPSGRGAKAGGGTLFLDEIGALIPSAQEQLAQRLDEQKGEGARRGASGEFRLIAATSRRLVDLLSDGTFDERLFHRLNAFPIWMPPLRERRSDIPALARSLLARLASEAGRPFVSEITPAAMELLVAEPWPGNIRELQSAIFRAVMLCEDSELRPQDFPQLAARSGSADRDVSRAKASTVPSYETAGGVAVPKQVYDEHTATQAVFADTGARARYGIARLLDDRGEMRPFEVLEEEVIRFALDHYGGRMSEVARRLGIGRSTLYRKVREYGIASGAPVAS